MLRRPQTIRLVFCANKQVDVELVHILTMFFVTLPTCGHAYTLHNTLGGIRELSKQVGSISDPPLFPGFSSVRGGPSSKVSSSTPCSIQWSYWWRAASLILQMSWENRNTWTKKVHVVVDKQLLLCHAGAAVCVGYNLYYVFRPMLHATLTVTTSSWGPDMSMMTNSITSWLLAEDGYFISYWYSCSSFKSALTAFLPIKCRAGN